MQKEMNTRHFDRILVVDDTTANLELLTNVLTAQGYAVYPASDGELALEFVRTTLPDLILLDIRLPGIDGYEVCRRFKADERTRSIPIIFISALESENEKVKGFQAGAVDYIAKPFQAEEVLARVRIHLHLRELTEHLEQKVAERTEELTIAKDRLQQELAARKSIEETLRASEEKYRRIVDTAAEGVWAIGPDTRTTLVNTRMTEMLGYSAAEMIGLPISDFMFEEDVADHLQKMEARGKGASENYERRLRCKDGRTIWTSISATGIFDDEHCFHGSFGMISDITERKQAQMKLAKERALLRILIDSVSDLIFIKDRNGVYQGCNKANEEFIGIPECEQIGKTDFVFIDREKAEEVRQAERRVLEDGKPLRIEEWVTDRHGRRLLMETLKAPYYDPDGEALGLVGVGRDITERKRVEQERLVYLKFLENMDSVNRAIQENNDLEQMMSNVLDVMLSIFDCDRAWLVYPCDPNAPSWSVPMERTKPEYLGVNVLGMEMPMDPGVAESFRIQLASNGPVKYGPGTEHPLPEDVSEQFGFKSFLSLALHPRIGKSWQFGMHQYSFARIWTKEEERLLQEIGRRLEDALTSLLMHRNLQESEQRYRIVFENSPVSIWEEDFSAVKALLDDLKKQGIADIETYFDQHPETVQHCAESVKIVDVNRATLALHGATKKEELLAGLVNTFTPESFDTFRQELVCLWDGGTEMASDSVVKTLAGERRNVAIYFCVCPGHEDTLSKVLVSLIDITERRQVEEEIFKYREHLEELVRERTAALAAANKEMHAFTYTVSHDLRAPVRHIDGFLELLQKKAGTALDEQSHHYMDAISGAAKKMGLLIEDLLSFSRMGRHALLLQQVDLDSLVRDVIRELEPNTAGRHIEWRIGDLPRVSSDAAMLRIVLLNLISNALKFTRPRQQVQIEIGSLPGQPSETVIFIKDNGVGFDMIYVDKLFGVFQRLHRTEDFEGTGIGLANVRRIIARHGGRTWAEGTVDQGAIFYFSLPSTIGKENE